MLVIARKQLVGTITAKGNSNLGARQLAEYVNRKSRRIGKRFIKIIKRMRNIVKQILTANLECSMVRTETFCYDFGAVGLVEILIV